ncbi:MAG TPA: glutamine synthetase family protein [Treponemataceae bacterium]|nr:glutamine synthetase family protein [Treponemataceae bacterium]HOS31433.1 glutamine synthetase family protein [Treponemataceae bacterium]HQL05071.1 glutamine synthetase family protein [Treponemataceae bacterium]
MGYTEKEVLQFVEQNDVKFIKLTFIDIFGNSKNISIMPDELPRAFSHGIPFDASEVKGFMKTFETDLFLVPDPSTLAVLPWRPQHGRVVRFYCSIVYPDGRSFEGDSRCLLKQTVGELQKEGISCRIGTECEFYLFELDEKGNSTLTPHDNASYCDTAPLDKGENVRRDICLTLEEMGIKPESSHHETGPGQHEIDFKCSETLTAADNLATFKMVVKTIAAKNGLHASFHPKPLYVDNDEVHYTKSGSGLHINFSLHKDGKNLLEHKDENDSLHPAAANFIAGILYRIKDITAFLNPVEESYNRLGSFEAPGYISWSKQNRSQLIRIPSSYGDNFRFELRSPDPMCNQYIALSLLLKAGLEGIKDKRELPKPCNIDFSIDKPDASIERLPQTLNEAKIIAAKSTFIAQELPAKITAAILS